MNKNAKKRYLQACVSRLYASIYDLNDGLLEAGVDHAYAIHETTRLFAIIREIIEKHPELDLKLQG